MDQEPRATPPPPVPPPRHGPERAAPPFPARRPRVLGWLSLGLVTLPLLALGLGLTALWQGLHTEAGTRWWLLRIADHVPGVQIEEPRGALLGTDSRFLLKRLSLRLGRSTVDVDELELGGLRLHSLQSHAPFLAAHASVLRARRVGVTTATDPTPSPPAAAPRSLVPPVALRIDALRLDEFRLDGLGAPVEALQARLEWSAALLRIDGASARWRGLVADGQAQIETTGRLAVSSRASLRAEPGTPDKPSLLPAGSEDFKVEAQAAGPLARFDVAARLSLRAQNLDARAQVTPFDPLPVSQLDGRFAKLDLAPLAALLGPGAGVALPNTALDGELLVQLNREQPLVVRSRVRNALPGRWDRARLPLAELDVLARGRGAAWTIERGQARLAAEGSESAGSVAASGSLDGRVADLKIELSGVRLQSLDARAPPLQLSGPLRLKHEPAAASATADSAQALGLLTLAADLQGLQVAVTGASSPARSQAGGKASARSTTAPASREPVALKLQARADLPASRFMIESLQARHGTARLDGSGELSRAGTAWAARGKLALADFNPSLWLPGDPGAVWRRARNRLAGEATLEASLPESALATSAQKGSASWTGALKGKLDAHLQDSVFAGQPLAVKLTAQADGRGGLTSQGEAVALGNRAKLDLDLTLPGAAVAASDTTAGAERLRVDIDAPRLDQLAPLAQAFGLAALSGQVRGQASADGPLGAWLSGTQGQAALRTRGEAKLQGVQIGNVGLGSADGRWDLTLPGLAGMGPGVAGRPAATDPKLDAQIDLRDLRLPGMQVPAAALMLSGSLASHRATLSASLEPRAGSTAAAKAASDATPAGLPRAAPTRLALDASLGGQWQAAAASSASPVVAGGVWRGQIESLTLQAPLDPRRATVVTPVLAARSIDVTWAQSPSGHRLAAAAGLAEVMGAAVRWSQAEWSRLEGRDRLALEAEIEPLRIAPLLQRFQPDFGWGGDLLIGARASVRSEPAFTARIEVARQSGDLSVEEFGTVQSLGLNALRLELNVENGVWRATQVIAGDTLGRVAGAQSVRNAGTTLWPAAEAPVEGAIRVQVDKLATWGAWVPAGWRLGGSLDGVLTIAGRFGAPELLGELTGSELALRNALEGVAWSEGELAARFEGSTAKLDKLDFRAGDGRLKASGEARLGAEPKANLRLLAERATVLGRVDRRVVVSGEARVALDAQSLAIEGEVRADEGLIDISRGDAPRLGDDVSVRRSAVLEDLAATEVPQTPRSTTVKLAVDLGSNFRLRGRGLDTRLTGRLQLANPKGKLTAAGEIRTDRGTYEAYGQKLAIERGVIVFVSDIANPRLDIEAVRANTDTRVGVLVSGSAQAPRVRLFSDPELPATDKLALLVTGRSYDSLGGAQTVLLQQAAMALLSGDGAEESSFDVARLLQLDELSVRQSDGTVRDTVVTLGKQISERVYVGYERGLNATAGNWQLIYRIARRFTLRAQSGDDPAVDFIWVFRWN